MTSVRSSRSAASKTARSTSASARLARLTAPLQGRPAPLAAAGRPPCRSSGVERAQRALRRGQDRPLAQQLGLDRGQLVGGRGGAQWPSRPPGGCASASNCWSVISVSHRSPNVVASIRHSASASTIREMLRAPVAVTGHSPPHPARCRWRNASKHSTAQATPTLSDSAWPSMGMATESADQAPAPLVARARPPRCPGTARWARSSP